MKTEQLTIEVVKEIPSCSKQIGVADQHGFSRAVSRRVQAERPDEIARLWSGKREQLAFDLVRTTSD